MINKIAAMLEGIDAADLDRLPPIQLQRFAQLCQHWQRQAEARRRQLAEARPKSGVLADLQNGKIE